MSQFCVLVCVMYTRVWLPKKPRGATNFYFGKSQIPSQKLPHISPPVFCYEQGESIGAGGQKGMIPLSVLDK